MAALEMTRLAGRICLGRELSNGGDGVRFFVCRGGRTLPAFVVRYRGEVRAYLNQCAHRALELDIAPRRFFDMERKTLICATHGARYRPVDGACVGGPCAGTGLIPVAVREVEKVVVLVDGEFELANSQEVNE
jgi:nitrite reductase/ring-hydroxylating ferredoxin subunit